MGWGRIALVECTLFCRCCCCTIASIGTSLRTQAQKICVSHYAANLRCVIEVSLRQRLCDLVLQFLNLECLILSRDKHRHAVPWHSHGTIPYRKVSSQLQVCVRARVCLLDEEDYLEMVQFDLVMRPFVILRAKLVQIIANAHKLSLKKT